MNLALAFSTSTQQQLAEWRQSIVDSLSPYHKSTVRGFPVGNGLSAAVTDAKPDLVINLSTGRHGLHSESYVPAILEDLGVCYTGSDVLTTALCQDKFSVKTLLLANKIPTPRGVLLNQHSVALGGQQDWEFPVIVKPASGRDGIGIFDECVTTNPEDLAFACHNLSKEFPDGILLEEYVQGREFSVGILGNGDTIEILPVMEIHLDDANSRIFSDTARDRIAKMPDCIECPAQLSKHMQEKLLFLARKVFFVLGCRDWVQIDFRVGSDAIPYVIDIDCLPTLNDPSRADYMFMATRNGRTRADVMRTLIQTALTRYGNTH